MSLWSPAAQTFSNKAKVVRPSDPAPVGRLARISRPKLTGIGRHEGVLLPSGMVIHTTAAAGGISRCTFREFQAGHEVKIEVELPPQQHRLAIERIYALIAANAPYDAIQNNCEMFARAAVLEEPWSPQVGLWLLAFVAASIFFSGEAAS